jgi:hypothetical protein
MEEILRFLQNYEIWIYIILGIGVLFPANEVIRSLRDWRGAAFGLERESARRRFSNGLTVLLVFIVLGAMEFFLVSFLLPNRPSKAVILATPTIDLLAAPTVTLAAGARTTLTPTGLSLTLAPVTSEGCTPGNVEWTFPKNGGELVGIVQLKGTIQVANLGFYKYEFSPVGTEKWVTIAAGSGTVRDANLGGQWNTGQLTPGDYRLRLVVADNKNQLLPACVITIRIKAP